MEIEGHDLTRFDLESGGHRIQRIPPTERSGRIHTSTVVVAIQSKETTEFEKYDKRSDSDFRYDWFSGSGAGGQHRNKKKNSCRVTHIPTGITKSAQTRDREASKKQALQDLIYTLDSIKETKNIQYFAQNKKQQTGTGERGDKIRTYRFQDDITTDHRTGKKASTAKIMKGHFELII